VGRAENQWVAFKLIKGARDQGGVEVRTIRADYDNGLGTGRKSVICGPVHPRAKVTIALGREVETLTEPATHLYLGAAIETDFECQRAPVAKGRDPGKDVLGHFPLELGCSLGPQMWYEARLGGPRQREAGKDDEFFSGHSLLIHRCRQSFKFHSIQYDRKR
jgi:hypothetical protein